MPTASMRDESASLVTAQARLGEPREEQQLGVVRVPLARLVQQREGALGPEALEVHARQIAARCSVGGVRGDLRAQGPHAPGGAHRHVRVRDEVAQQEDDDDARQHGGWSTRYQSAIMSR
ncbi:MAG: hypothetical protein R3B40_04975 [Polyangiales bacterium]